MRKKLSLLVVGLLAGATLSMTAASPAQAQVCQGEGPPFEYVCMVVNEADPVGWVTYYYWKAGEVVDKVTCTLWPPC